MRPCNGLSVGVAKLEKRKKKGGGVVWEKNAYIKKNLHIQKNKNKNKREREKQRKKSAHIKKKLHK